MLCMNEFTLFVGGGGVVTFERKEICNFVLFCWTLTNCRIPHLIVLVVPECCWFVQKLGKWGLECVVWYGQWARWLLAGLTAVGHVVRTAGLAVLQGFLLCINELCRASVVIRLQAGQLRRVINFFLFSKKGQTGSGPQPASYSVGPTGSFLGAWNLPLVICLIGRLIMSGVARLLPPYIFITY